LHPPDRPAPTLFLCGDVMTGRGIDQILPHPAAPRLYEPCVRSALDYVALAERATGPIARPAAFGYVWGEALAALERARTHARIINLETAVTAAGDAWPYKGIHYRMHPDNVACLSAAAIDCCVLANNHVLDWGRGGLVETLDTLHRAGIRTAGAGRDAEESCAPAILPVPGPGRVLVFGFATADSGVPPDWAAERRRPGVALLPDLSASAVEEIGRRIAAVERPGDLVVVSIHWGANWGFGIRAAERRFARRLVEAAGADVVHGHSSHHVKGIEVHRGKLILYGCGDFLNDYEGIGGHEHFRGDLALMYFPTVEAGSGRLVRLLMSPTQIRHFRVNPAPEDGVRWLGGALNREGRALGTRVRRGPEGTLELEWDARDGDSLHDQERA
jgi:poly-gamma-glutamate synthesis protein (capsule biosynthesis protein)